MTTLNKSNFFQKIQQILEQYYLKPFNDLPKSNLKNGALEREVHGAMHASRAALWVWAMHRRLQKISPDFVNGSMDKIARKLHIDTEELLLLILVSMVCHDAARNGEGKDLWEEQSAKITQGILVDLGLSEHEAKLFSVAIEYKDQPEAYILQLQQLGIEQQDCNAFGYIRVIINLGDNLDLMRCVGNFMVKNIFDTLKNIDGFDETLHEHDIMALVKDIHQVIHEQGDMLFACNVIDLKGETYVSSKAYASAKKKVSYEHADNVLAALFEDIAKISTIQPLLTGLNPPKAQKYNTDTYFSPYIHGTNSSIFSILSKSNFEIMSPLEMMRKHRAAPMSGELTQGGYGIIDKEAIGKTSFAKISAQGENAYTLEKVIANYTNLSVGLAQNNIKNFKDACTNGFKKSYLNINLILIYFVRARQSHQSLEEVINADELELLLARMEASYQFYYFMQLLGTHIFPDVAELNKYRVFGEKGVPGFTEEGKLLGLAASNFLTYENIVQKIMDNKLNIKEIVDNPTKQQLQTVLDILEVPKKCTLNNHMIGAVIPDVELPLTQFFSLKPDSFSYVIDNYGECSFSSLSLNGGDSNSIHNLFSAFIRGFAPNELFLNLGVDARKWGTALHEHIELFRSLANTPQIQFKITESQEYFLEHKFPLILVSASDEGMTLINFKTEEYRSNVNLKLGTDIKIIATDTNEHRLEVLKYLALHQINNIQVLLFNDLKNIKENHQKISSPQHHSDSFPSLKWMAAQQVVKPDSSETRATASLFFQRFLMSPKLRSKGYENEVLALLDDAKTYKDIQLKFCCTYRCTSQEHHEVIELLVKAGLEQNEFKSLIGSSVKYRLVKLIRYLAELNLPQFYKDVLSNDIFSTALNIFLNLGIKEDMTELLENSEVIKFLYLYGYSCSQEHIKAMMALHKYQPDLLSGETGHKILGSNKLVELIVYFEKNNLQKYFEPLLKNSKLAYSLLSVIEDGKITNEFVSSVLDDPNMLEALSKGYIHLSNLKQLNAGFILSAQGIEISCTIDYPQTVAIHKLNQHGFTERSLYLKVFTSESVTQALCDNEINTPFQIQATLNANKLGIIDTELCMIKKHYQLAKMLAFANNKSEWNLYSEFYVLLSKFDALKDSFESSNTPAYHAAGELIQKINKEIDSCFSLESNDSNNRRMDNFSTHCNLLINAVRAVLELNTGVFGIIDSFWSYSSSFMWDSKSESNHVSYSFFKNDSAKLIGAVKENLEQMKNEATNGKIM